MLQNKTSHDQSNSYLLFSVAVFVAYFFSLFCISTSALTVTHEDLLYENSVLLQFTGVKIPLKTFFFISTTIVVLFFAIISLILQKKLFVDSALVLYINKKIYKINVVSQFLCHIDIFLQNRKYHLPLTSLFFLLLNFFTFSTIYSIIYSYLPYHGATITYYQKTLLIVCAYIALKAWKNILAGINNKYIFIFFKYIMYITLITCVSIQLLILTLPHEDKFLYDSGFAVRGNLSLTSDGVFPLAKEFTPSWFDPINNFLSRVGFLRIYESIPRDLDLRGKTIAIDSNYKESINNILTIFNNYEDQVAKYTTIKPAKILFWGRDLQGADFSSAIFCNAEFDGVNLTRADFSNAKFYNSVFQNSIVSRANLNNIEGRALKFWRVNLTYSKFNDAKLRGAFFNSCDMTFSEFRRADLTAGDIYSSRVQAVDFNSANLNGTIFVNSGVSGCMFRLAHMSGTILRCEKLIACDFRSISYDGTLTTTIRENFFHEYNVTVLGEMKNSFSDQIFKTKTEAIPVHCIYENVPSEWNFPACHLSLFDYSIYKTLDNVGASCRYPEEISEPFMYFTQDDTEGLNIIENKKRELLTRLKVIQKIGCSPTMPLPVYTALQLAEVVDGLELLLSKESTSSP